MAKIKVSYGKTIAMGKIPEVKYEATYENDIPPGVSEEDFFRLCWEKVEREVEEQVRHARDLARPRCEKCGKAVESLFSVWDEERREYMQLCFEDYQKSGTACS
ncbi:MAG: hypothetical protein RDV48_20890 [Candidatus Eremiobacteraeota bacterium]|nr:hypothetical protein [Candidatus Eremiobacteraeota bacterium]